jgi:hypothetical protein
MLQLRAGTSTREVVRLFNCHQSTVVRLRQRFQTTNNVSDRPRPGQPRVTTDHQDRHIRLQHLHNRFKTAASTARETPGRHNPSMPKYPSECTGGSNCIIFLTSRIPLMGLETRLGEILIFPYLSQRISDKIIQNPLWTVRHFSELMNYTTWSTSSRILLQRCQIYLWWGLKRD